MFPTSAVSLAILNSLVAIHRKSFGSLYLTTYLAPNESSGNSSIFFKEKLTAY